jgi:hypothetical protein
MFGEDFERSAYKEGELGERENFAQPGEIVKTSSSLRSVEEAADARLAEARINSTMPASSIKEERNRDSAEVRRNADLSRMEELRREILEKF